MAKAHFHRANALLVQDRLDDAIVAFRIARQFEPMSMEICFNLGLTLRKAGILEASSEALEATTNLAPSFADGWFNLGLIRQDQRRYDEAISSFRAALRSKPDYAEAAVNLGIVLQESGSIEGAIEAYRIAMRLRPETFGRIAQAMTGAKTGRLWLDLEALRHHLSA
jgi:tetratricopeptide (TPR) repeat protein